LSCPVVITDKLLTFDEERAGSWRRNEMPGLRKASYRRAFRNTSQLLIALLIPFIIPDKDITPSF
jgi:hypothetical protein